MTKGIIIHLDDDEIPLKACLNKFNQSELKNSYDLVQCKTEAEFQDIVKEKGKYVRCIIFDIVGRSPDKDELENGHTKFMSFIEESFANFNIPIFIYSGYLQILKEKFIDCGTIFKMDKGIRDQGFDAIFKKIKLFHDSGFLDLFCPGGFLEIEMYKEMHQTFVKQFRSGEIESIITTVQHTNAADCKLRCTDLFKRIAVQTLMSKLVSPVIEDDATVNAIEHYYRRMNSIKFWTGDILEKNDKSERIIILTPRCDCNLATTYFVCNVDPDFPMDNKKEKIRRALTDNALFSGAVCRYLPPAPLFSGGKVVYSSHKTIKKEDLTSNYHILITLSDNLTNEIIAKMCSHFLRTGINTINVEELVIYLDSLKETPNG